MGEKNYWYDQCDKAFTYHSSLRHKRTHSGEKPYEWNQWSNAFAIHSNFQKCKGIHIGKKPYECD